MKYIERNPCMGCGGLFCEGANECMNYILCIQGLLANYRTSLEGRGADKNEIEKKIENFNYFLCFGCGEPMITGLKHNCKQIKTNHFSGLKYKWWKPSDPYNGGKLFTLETWILGNLIGLNMNVFNKFNEIYDITLSNQYLNATNGLSFNDLIFYDVIKIHNTQNKEEIEIEQNGGVWGSYYGFLSKNTHEFFYIYPKYLKLIKNNKIKWNYKMNISSDLKIEMIVNSNENDTVQKTIDLSSSII